MPLHDLTPQIRTRLNRAERLVGFFVGLAVLTLICAFAYFAVNSARKKGWFLNKADYFTFVDSAAGLTEGDKVKLMGFDVGEITKIEAMPADDPTFNVYVEFVVRSPYYGYLWSDSSVRTVSGDFLGNRYLEVTRGVTGNATYLEEEGELTQWFDGVTYQPIESDTKPVWLLAKESKTLNAQIDELLLTVQTNLPYLFALTNQVSQMMTNATQLSMNVNDVVLRSKGAVDNLVSITENLKNPKGAMGEWILPPRLNDDLHHTLLSTTNVLDSADRNMTIAVSNLSLAVGELATLTGSLNEQVQANTNILAEISGLVVTANNFMNHLKDHWLLRSAFKEKKKRR